MSSSFGKLFCLTSFGESHGLGIGGVIDGCPAGLELDFDFIQKELDKRKPGSYFAGLAGTKRIEKDQFKILSGTFENKTLGTPLAFFVENQNQKPKDYTNLSEVFRPGHADISYQAKYGIYDFRGGGRSSGRESVARVFAGAIAMLFLKTLGIEIYAYPLAIGGIYANDYGELDIYQAENRKYFAPNEAVIEPWNEKLTMVKKLGDSLGGLIRVEAHRVPAGLGEPVFNKLDAALASAIMGVGSIKGVEIGSGFGCVNSLGSENNDSIVVDDLGQIQFKSNHAGGILGGISSGQNIIITAAAKPIASIARQQQTINKSHENVLLEIDGRHDVCVIPRIVPVLKAMTALTLADMILLQRRMKF